MTNPTVVPTQIFNDVKLTQTIDDKKDGYVQWLTLNQENLADVASTTDGVKYTLQFSLADTLSSQLKYQATEINGPSINLRLTPKNIKNYNREVTKKQLLPCQGDIIAERSKLIDKKFKDGLSKLEERRLKYLDWQLDRIDDALNGEHLDKLDKIVQMHEQLARTVENFAKNIKKATPKTSKHNKQRKRSKRSNRRK